MKKRRIKIKRLFILIVVLGLLIYGCIFIVKLIGNHVVHENVAYISSNIESVDILDENFKKVDTIFRGTEVKLKKKVTDKNSGIEYYLITYDKKDYYIGLSNVVTTKEAVIQEKEMYVRTPVTLYENFDSIHILYSIKKGEKLDIIGYDKINDGKVNMYKVTYNDLTGYVYAKYLLSSLDDAIKNYDSDASYLIHAARANTYGGGSGGKLDYYPYEKAKFADNVMPDEVRSLYINSSAIKDVDAYIEFAKDNNINAFVVDIKDNMTPAYPARAFETYSKTNYEHAINSYDDYKNYIKKLKDNGFYVIGRITTFKDSYYVEDHPESAISDSKTGSPYKHNGSYWPSAFDRGVWEFSLALALESVDEFGFNEIQFDYVRFPDRTLNIEKSGAIDMKNKYSEEKAEAIQGFLFYVTDRIHEHGAYVAADVFGESAYTYIPSYGQYWPAMSNIVDVMSAMPYPDHFNKNEFGIKEVVWTVPEKLLNAWGTYVANRQSEIPTPAIVRTWIQTYDTIKEPYIVYDANKISEQISGLYSAGLKGGYMTWNSGSSLSKYKAVAAAFKKEY